MILLPELMDTIFKKSTFILNNKIKIYYRPGGINKKYIYRILFFPEYYLIEVGRQIYGK